MKMVKDTALTGITLRKYEKPYETSKRELVKKICLSLGLLQEGDSRDVVVDVLMSLIQARGEKSRLTSIEIGEKVKKIREENSLEMKGIAESNIRRQLKRLGDLMIIEKKNNLYNLSEFESLSSIFENKIENFLIPQTISRIKEYLTELDKQ